MMRPSAMATHPLSPPTPAARCGYRPERSAPPLILLAGVTAVAPASLHILVPALPVLAAVFDAPPGAVQLVLTLFLSGIAAGQLVYGPVSDRYGRRPVLIAGLALFLFGTVLCGFAWSLPVLIFGDCGGTARIRPGLRSLRAAPGADCRARPVSFRYRALRIRLVAAGTDHRGLRRDSSYTARSPIATGGARC